jgi:hypothetical protein
MPLNDFRVFYGNNNVKSKLVVPKFDKLSILLQITVNNEMTICYNEKSLLFIRKGSSMKKMLPIIIIIALVLMLLLVGCPPPEPDSSTGCYINSEII